MKKLFAVILAFTLAFTTGVSAQSDVNIIPLFSLYDLDSETDISCSFATEVLASGLATTSGSSTTTTSVSSSGVFNNIAVGDIIWASISGARTGRTLTARASADSATVDSAWTLPAAGVSLRYQRPTCGAPSGWVAVDGAKMLIVAVNLSQISVTSGGIGFKIEGKFDSLPTAGATNLWPGDASADAHCDSGTYASGYCVFTAVDAFSVSNAGVQKPMFIRLVAQFTATDDANDLTTNLEQISASLQVSR